MSIKQEIGQYIRKKITYLKETGEYTSTKAELAQLRRGVGHKPGELPKLYGILLKDMPEDFWNSEGYATKQEWSCYIALTLYAWHQQGNDIKTQCVHTFSKRSLGSALRLLTYKSNDSNAEERVLKKMQILITSNDMDEFAYHLKNIITLLRSEAISLNYAELAEDVYAFQFEESKKRVSLKWGQDFYREIRRITKMSKNLYFDVHVLQTVPPSCVNRDDTGSPKSAVYGGVNRARVSSQAWKRAMRLEFKRIFDPSLIGYRTKNIESLLIEQMKELDPTKEKTKLEEIAKIVLDESKIKKENKKDVLFFISSKQVKALAEIALEYAADATGKSEKKKIYKDRWQDALKKNPSIDILLFGRMAASNVELNCDAAAQVAHCISTHAVSNEYDYFTAVDDCSADDNAGAGHLGTVEFNSSTLYRYSTVNIAELMENGLSIDEVCDVLSGYLEAFIKAMPTGKQNTFANRTLPCFTYVTIREDQPINMAGAFEKAVTGNGKGYEKDSIDAFLEYTKKVYENYAEYPKKSFVVCLDDVNTEAERVKMKDLARLVEKEIRNYN